MVIFHYQSGVNTNQNIYSLFRTFKIMSITKMLDGLARTGNIVSEAIIKGIDHTTYNLEEVNCRLARPFKSLYYFVSKSFRK